MKLIAKHDLVVIGLIFLVLVVFELSPFGGNVRFYAKWIACNQKPVKTALKVGGGPVFYSESPSFEPIRSYQPSYYCTPLDAEKAGISANPDHYEFPYLNAEQ